MIQLSEHIYCEDFLETCDIENRFLPNPYHQYPFMLIEDFLTPQQCSQITATMKNDSNSDDAMIKSLLQDSVVTPSVDEQLRKTKIHVLSEPYLSWYQQSFLHHQNSMESFFNIALTTSTKPQVLEYTQGHFYTKHSDDSSELISKDGKTIGFKCVAPQRKFTTVFFVSSHEEDFKGGELIFNYLYDENSQQIILKPKAGTMVVFPSNPYFSHEVKPVHSGYRLTVAQWHNALI
ncbi:MAG: 2OG-Fe(II) oxygenase [Campylobacterota bacterium]|nr:2OG-Fe(II) oxygenase [Campylobacterota bacterium]